MTSDGERAMNSEIVNNPQGYGVPCRHSISGTEKSVCIVVHGFGSSKDSSTAAMMLRELPQAGIGAIALDLPAHGESAVDGDSLRLENCLADLKAVEVYAQAKAPEAGIVYFASSFGAYVTLLHLASEKRGNCRAFLRSAAVTMPELLSGILTPEQRRSLDDAGEFVMYTQEQGYARDLKLTKAFFSDLDSSDLFAIWREGMAELCMIHGEADSQVPLGDAQLFSKKFNAPLTVVPNGDHQLSAPGVPEQALRLAVEFFSSH